MEQRLKAIAGAGFLPALFVSVFHGDETLQVVMFLFGASWGGLFLLHADQ